MDHHLALDRPLLNPELHQAFIVPDPVEGFEVFENSLSLVGEVTELGGVDGVVHVVDEVRSERSNSKSEQSG